MIVSSNLDKASAKIYKRINKIRGYGWFSKDVQNMLKRRYGEEKKELLAELSEETIKRNQCDDKIKTLAKKINKIK